MELTIYPNKLNGEISAIPSKSMAHRYLICAAFADAPTSIVCPATSRDIETTVECLRRIGAKIIRTKHGYSVFPLKTALDHALLPCGESGSTLRFLLPVAGALGIDVTFTMGQRLSQRPLEPLLQEMRRMGYQVTWLDSTTLHCHGQLHSGSFRIPGNISSQFVSGLLFACVLLNGNSSISVYGNVESRPYIGMTISALSQFGVTATLTDIHGMQLVSPGFIQIEGDWSSSSYYFAANEMGSTVSVHGLLHESGQGDRAVTSLLEALNTDAPLDVSDVPDLVPILSVVAAAKKGAIMQNIGRLRMKESDRVTSVLSMLHALGICATADENSMTIYPGSFHSCTVDAFNDHRIAMAAAIAATNASGPVTVTDAQCVEKSYPGFWEDYQMLGGNYEQHLR